MSLVDSLSLSLSRKTLPQSPHCIVSINLACLHLLTRGVRNLCRRSRRTRHSAQMLAPIIYRKTCYRQTYHRSSIKGVGMRLANIIFCSHSPFFYRRLFAMQSQTSNYGPAPAAGRPKGPPNYGTRWQSADGKARLGLIDRIVVGRVAMNLQCRRLSKRTQYQRTFTQVPLHHSDPSSPCIRVSTTWL